MSNLVQLFLILVIGFVEIAYGKHRYHNVPNYKFEPLQSDVDDILKEI
jgi:hypothetical protein